MHGPLKFRLLFLPVLLAAQLCLPAYANDLSLDAIVGSECAAIFQDARSRWNPSQFTDPKDYQPDNFQFIVHGVGGVQSTMRDAQTIELFKNPEPILKDRAHISASLIDQDHCLFAGSYGFILKVPEENIFAASPSDFIV